MHFPKIKNLIIHPVFFAAYQVLFLYQYNFEDIKPLSLILPLISVLLLSSLFWFFVNFFSKRPEKAAIYTTAFIFLFFTYGRFLDIVSLPQYKFWRYKIHSIYLILFLLIYGAIFAPKKLYECQVKRLMSRASELSLLYNSKSVYLSSGNCDSITLQSGLAQYANYTNGLNESIELRSIRGLSDELENKNGRLLCKLF